LDDPVALEEWIDAHARKHHAVNQLVKLSGGHQLHGPIDGDWMYRHWARHVALASSGAFGPDLSGFTHALALPHKWQTEQELYDWHELHNRHHLKIDRQLNL
jgi:hypothetical protein